MTKKFANTGFTFLITAILAGTPLFSNAEPSTNSAAQAAPKHRIVPVPFHGQLSAVDRTKQTITFVDASKVSTTVRINDDTKITKDDKKAKLEEAVLGDPCGGQYVLSEDGQKTAKTFHFGRKPKKVAAPVPVPPVKN